jgi:hypothetical protein
MTSGGRSYVYRSATGAPVYRVVRRGPDQFYQERYTDAGWESGLKNVKRVPYRLPELFAIADQGGAAFVVEGEKDVERLIDELSAAGQHSMTATTSAQGAGFQWPACWAGYFRGFDRVFVVGDDDLPGRKAAEQRARVAAISGAVTKCQLCLPRVGVNTGGDISDYFNNQGTVAELLDLVEGAPQIRAEYARDLELQQLAATLEGAHGLIVGTTLPRPVRRELAELITPVAAWLARKDPHLRRIRGAA